MEGNTYLCGWRLLNSEFAVWVLKTPRVKAVASTFVAADELLAEKICSRFGDGESKREYVPSPPLRGRKKRLLVTVHGDSSVAAVNADQLYANGRCAVCRAVLGARTAIPIQIENITQKQRNGFFVSSGHVMRVFSKPFVKLIEKVTEVNLRWRTVEGGGKYELVELIGGAEVREVVPKNLKLGGWRCSSCGISRILGYADQDGIRTHVAATDFNNQIPGIFAIRHPQGIMLGMTDAVWGEVRTESEAKGLMSTTLGMIVDEEISSLSQLPSFEDYQANPRAVLS